MTRWILFGLLVLLAGLSPPVAAADAYVTVDVHLRAGPDIGYPSVVLIPAGTVVRIEGCTDDWIWCDVLYGDDRGWVAGTYLQDAYRGRPVRVPAYGARLGIPIVTFSIVTYWGRHYPDRPFYRERERWYRRPPPHHAPPPPLHRPRVHPDGRPVVAPPAHAPPRVPGARPTLPPPSRSQRPSAGKGKGHPRSGQDTGERHGH